MVQVTGAGSQNILLTVEWRILDAFRRNVRLLQKCLTLERNFGVSVSILTGQEVNGASPISLSSPVSTSFVWFMTYFLRFFA